MPTNPPKKLRGPSRPIDPRNAPGVPRRSGPDRFGMALIGVSTAFVLLLVIFIAVSQNTTTTTTTTTAGATAVTNPVTGSGAEATTAANTAVAISFATQTADLPRITVDEAKAQLASGAVKIFDVREKTVYDTEHVQGATNIPYTEANARLAEFPKTGNVVLYCQ